MGGICSAGEPTLEDANDTLEMQIQSLERRIVKMTRDAKTWAAQVDSEPTAKMRAMQCLKKKRQYEQQRDRLISTQSNVESAQFQQEQTAVALKTAQALRKGHDKMKDQQEKMNVDKLEQLMDDMQDGQLALRETQDALARNGAIDGIREDDFEAEFQRLTMDTVEKSMERERYERYVEAVVCAAHPSMEPPAVDSVKEEVMRSPFKARCPAPPIAVQEEVQRPAFQPPISRGATAPSQLATAPPLAQVQRENAQQAERDRLERERVAQWERVKMEARAQDWAATALPLGGARGHNSQQSAMVGVGVPGGAHHLQLATFGPPTPARAMPGGRVMVPC